MAQESKGKDKQQNKTSTDINDPPLVRPSLTIDYAQYQHYLDEADLTEAQKRDFLDALWFVICSFVDLGYDIHPLQQVDDACEQIKISSEDILLDAPDMIECKKAAQSEFCSKSDRNSSDLQSVGQPERRQK